MATATTLVLDQHDQALVEAALSAMRAAYENAHATVAVAKRISVLAVRQRNKGRSAAMKRHPFRGICEQSGSRIERHDAVLDEMEPGRGYAGPVRWVCHRANNSGKRSCGGC